jgi:hypothetical protein
MDRDRTGTDTIRTRRRRKGRLRACYRRCPIGPEYPDTGATLNNPPLWTGARPLSVGVEIAKSLTPTAILAACNTAAGTATEALSGVARALSAQRARCWSHTGRSTHATVSSSPRARDGSDPKVGRAGAHGARCGAHRQWSAAAHPTFWAPPFVVGGGRGGFFFCSGSRSDSTRWNYADQWGSILARLKSVAFRNHVPMRSRHHAPPSLRTRQPPPPVRIFSSCRTQLFLLVRPFVVHRHDLLARGRACRPERQSAVNRQCLLEINSLSTRIIRSKMWL